MEEDQRGEKIKVRVNKKIWIAAQIGIKDAKSWIEHVQKIGSSKMERVAIRKENPKTSIITRQ